MASNSRKTKRPSGDVNSTEASLAISTPPDGRQVELSDLTNAELRQELENVGEKPGPINASNRELYEGMLGRRWRTINIWSRESREGARDESVNSRQAEQTSPSPRKKARTGTKQKPKPVLKDITVKGVVPAAYTPFGEDGEVNLPAIDLLVDYFLRSGISTVFVNGMSGEGLALTVSERKATAERWLKAAAGRMTIIVHVGSPCVKDAKELASHAEAIGAHAISAIPPVFHKPATISNMLLFFKEVSAGAPSLPLFMYNNPDATGVHFDSVEVLKNAYSKVPNLRGAKFTSFNLTEFTGCLQLHDGFYQMMYGRDEQLLAALALGATACVGSTYNYTGRLNNRLLAAYRRGDMAAAQKEQYRSQAAVLVMKKYECIVGSAGVGKAIMQLIGLNLGPPRLPSVALSADQLKELRKDLTEIGFFDWH